MKKSITLFILFQALFLFAVPANAALRQVPAGSDHPSEILKYEVVDISFKASVQKGQDPFKVDFSASFTSPGNEVQEIPGFYNGEGEWIIRFSASLPGKWEYRTHSSVRKLDNKNGSITILDEPKPGQHGGIVIPADDPQHFSYEDGTPYFLMAYECDWLYALDYHNEEGAPQTEHFLDLLAGNGCTQIVMNVFAYDVSWPKDEKLKEHPKHDLGRPADIFPFLGNNENPDYAALNTDFFKKT